MGGRVVLKIPEAVLVGGGGGGKKRKKKREGERESGYGEEK
jgi:hypothetical protein